MNSQSTSQSRLPTLGLIEDAVDYYIDADQRWILFLDILRRRGNNYFQRREKGQPPVLIFDYDIILDGRTLDRPVNYSLAQIIDRRQHAKDVQSFPAERRRRPMQAGIRRNDPQKRPIVVIDPRAGQAPGIGGSKRDSEIGEALDDGHPVDVVLFSAEPMPGQTLDDVEKAEARFVETVGRRHPQAEAPAVIGNCQGGWAVALLGADRPDLTGPLLLNGAPLAYWSGVRGKNPMRYLGGLTGGIWPADLISDLGNGEYDGANLVMNFEELNPANTYWSKQYNLFANVDTEEQRYLNFEKWWDGFIFMTAEEMHAIIRNLFVGDQLEQGTLKLNGKKIDLKNIADPVLVFASEGDNITPPQQALDWIADVYGSVDEIKRREHVIVYMLDEKIGHLGIFVSGKIARKQHKEIIQNVDMLENLSPGLYEMIIAEGDNQHGITDYKVRFEERDIQDIMSQNDDAASIKEDQAEFRRVAAVSEINDRFYRTFVSPWVKMGTTKFSAELLKQLHPLRTRVYSFSDKNPILMPVKVLAPAVKNNRRPVSADNPFMMMEKALSQGMVTMLDCYRDIRDRAEELVFQSIYSNPWLDFMGPETAPEKIGLRETDTPNAKQKEIREDRQRWLKAMEDGGFVEGVVRIMLALVDADHIFERSEYDTCSKMVKSHRRLQSVTPSDFKRMITEQSRVLQTDEERALKTLNKLMPLADDRKEALDIAANIAFSGVETSDEEKAVFKKIQKALAH